MILFTSDLHLGHANVIKHCDRPFTSADEMDEALIENWNRRVHNTDTVYIIGDLMFRTRKHPADYLDRLHGKKALIIGNHDRDWMKKVDLTKYFMFVSHMEGISDGKRKIVLCHYPLMTWNGASKGVYHVYGHIHANKNAAFWPLLSSMENALNAGTDINGYAPVPFDELVENNIIFRHSSCDDPE